MFEFSIRTFAGVPMLALLLFGCAENMPYHKQAGTPGNCQDMPEEAACTQAYYQEYDGFDLAFAEYSDRGNAFSDVYIDDVLQRIREQAAGDGVVLVTFVHGWKHNAREDDPNLIDFKASLQALNAVLQQDFAGSELGRRRLVGLYIGWRGASIELPVLTETTFWDRKGVAEEVGKGGVTRLLMELDEITRGVEKNVMVVVGHSFGGAIVVSALNDVFTERVTQRTRGNRFAPTIGDGVVVINPAIEANQSLSFVEAAIREDYRPEQHPLFVSISTDADWATHYAFPAGQTIGLGLTWQQEDLERRYYYDRLKPSTKKPLREEHLDTTTVGNFAPFLTHRLTASGEGKQTLFHVASCDDDPTQCVPRGWTSLGGQPAIRNLPQNYPLFFYKTDATVMSGHNDIFNQRVRSFVITVIDDVVRRGLGARVDVKSGEAVAAQASILRRPKSLQRRMEEILQGMPAEQAGQ